MSRQQKFCHTGIMTGATIVLLLIYREDVLGDVLAPLTHGTVRATLLLLQLSGIEAVRVVTQIYHPDGFGYEVYYRCTGFLSAALLISSVLAYPGVLRSKFIGLSVAVPVLLFLNLARLVCLFYIGVHLPFAFGFAHSVIGPVFTVSATLGVWFIWVKWADHSDRVLN